MKLCTIALGLGVSMTSLAADWTPLLQDLQVDCVTADFADKVWQNKLPKSYQKDIKKRHIKANDYHGIWTLQLKNAYAFGSPLLSITHEGDLSGTRLILSFADDKFMRHLGDFKLQNGNKTFGAGSRHAWATDGYKTVLLPYPKNSDDLLAQAQDGYAIALTHKTGWQLADVYQYGLEFDKNNKQIRCYSIT